MSDKLVCPVCFRPPKIDFSPYGWEDESSCYDISCDQITHWIFISAKTEKEVKENWIKAFGDKMENQYD